MRLFRAAIPATLIATTLGGCSFFDDAQDARNRAFNEFVHKEFSAKVGGIPGNVTSVTWQRHPSESFGYFVPAELVVRVRGADGEVVAYRATEYSGTDHVSWFKYQKWPLVNYYKMDSDGDAGDAPASKIRDEFIAPVLEAVNKALKLTNDRDEKLRLNTATYR